MRKKYEVVTIFDIIRLYKMIDKLDKNKIKYSISKSSFNAVSIQDASILQNLNSTKCIRYNLIICSKDFEYAKKVLGIN